MANYSQDRVEKCVWSLDNSVCATSLIILQDFLNTNWHYHNKARKTLFL